MRTFDIIKNGTLEKIFDNTANQINCHCFDLFDPEFVIDSKDDIFLFYSKTADEQYGHITLTNIKNKKVKVTYLTNDGLIGYYKHFDDREFVGILHKKTAPDNAVGKQLSPIKMKIWNNILAKYNIERVSLKEFKKIFEKNKDLSLSEIYNQHLKFDDKIAVISEDVATFIYPNYHKDYSVFLLNQETVEKLASGYHNLKEQNPNIDSNDFYKELTIEKAIEAADANSHKTQAPQINYEQISTLQEIINNKYEEINKQDRYHFYSVDEEEKILLFFEENNIQTISKLSLLKNFDKEMWEEKQKQINNYAFFKNLHLFDLERNSRQKIERPQEGWIALKYRLENADYAFVPKSLARKWLDEHQSIESHPSRSSLRKTRLVIINK